MIAVSKSETASDNGIKIGDDTISVDLRSTLPSTFLRPHAQHGWTIKRKSLDSEHGLDMANNVVGILRIRVCDAFNWVGNGELLSQESLFPNPHFDQQIGKSRLWFDATYGADHCYPIPTVLY